MLPNFLRTTFSIAIPISLFFSTLFLCWIRADAATPGFNPPENYRKDNSLEKLVEPPQPEDEIDAPKDEMGMEDIFGSKQVFPFEMGLGNSAF